MSYFTRSITKQVEIKTEERLYECDQCGGELVLDDNQVAFRVSDPLNNNGWLTVLHGDLVNHLCCMRCAVLWFETKDGESL